MAARNRNRMGSRQRLWGTVLVVALAVAVVWNSARVAAESESEMEAEAVAAGVQDRPEQELRDMFAAWLKKHRRKYKLADLGPRFARFKDNVRALDRLREARKPEWMFRMDLTTFADHSDDEVRRSFGYVRNSAAHERAVRWSSNRERNRNPVRRDDGSSRAKPAKMLSSHVVSGGAGLYGNGAATGRGAGPSKGRSPFARHGGPQRDGVVTLPRKVDPSARAAERAARQRTAKADREAAAQAVAAGGSVMPKAPASSLHRIHAKHQHQQQQRQQQQQQQQQQSESESGVDSGLELNLPDSVDWSKDPKVTGPIRDQGECGACWAFVTAYVTEAANAIGGRPLTVNSPQYVLDCFLEAKGCKGGDPLAAQQWIVSNSGTCSDALVPYLGQASGSCNMGCEKSNAIAQTRWLPTMDENAILEALTKGPVAGALHADAASFKYYQGGIYNDEECPNQMANLNHAVSFVGYGMEDGVPYWIIRNTWGPNWGENGYIRIVRGANVCGILIDASQPSLTVATTTEAVANALPGTFNAAATYTSSAPSRPTVGLSLTSANPSSSSSSSSSKTPAAASSATATPTATKKKASTSPTGSRAGRSRPKPTPTPAQAADEIAEDGHVHNHGIDPE